MAGALVPIRGKPVLFQEGDVVVSTGKGLRNLLLLLVNRGVGSHAATVVMHKGELVCVSVCPHSWTDEHGRKWPGGGLTREPCALYGDRAYTQLSIYRSRAPRSAAQIAALRLTVASVLAKYGTSVPCYDGVDEFAHSGLGLQRATTDKWHCAEFCAWLLQVQGVWPKGKTLSVDVPTLCRIAGAENRIF